MLVTEPAFTGIQIRKLFVTEPFTAGQLSAFDLLDVNDFLYIKYWFQNFPFCHCCVDVFGAILRCQSTGIVLHLWTLCVCQADTHTY